MQSQRTFSHLSYSTNQRNVFHKAFTLIELSIVLVIIGLIVGGVLVGRDLIASAAIRSSVTQFEKFNQAVNAFRGKFDCLPGDCVNATNFFPTLGSNYCGSFLCANGNGDNKIYDAYNGAWPSGIVGEPVNFWAQLSLARLIECCNPASNIVGTYRIGYESPKDKVNGNGIAVTNLSGVNGYYWGHTTNTGAGVPGWVDVCGGNPDQMCNISIINRGVINPSQAMAFDKKIDDGMPTSGIIIAAGVWGGDNLVHPAPFPFTTSNICITYPSSGANEYNITLNSAACSFFIKIQ